MGDVAAILGVAGRTGAGASAPSLGSFRGRSLPALTDDAPPVKKSKKGRISREVSALLGGKPQEIIAPMVPVRKIALGGFKEKVGGKFSKKWAWKPIASSARKDGLQLSHWVRADAEFTDYPFARFNKRSEVIKYVDIEYHDMVEQDRRAMKPDHFEQQQELWPKDHTDHLFDLARRFELRWPLIIDRWEKKPGHQPEELKRRYYAVTARILRMRRGPDSRQPPTSLETFEYRFEHDRLRRKQLESAFVRSKDTTAKELELLTQLQSIEGSIRSLERDITKGKLRAAPLSALGAGAGVVAAGPGDVYMMDYGLDAELVAGSDAMAVRALASKSHPPFLPPPEYAGPSSSTPAPLIPPLRSTGGGRPAGAVQRGQAAAPAVFMPDRDAFKAPVMLRSVQMTVPPDFLPPDSKSLAKVAAASALLHVPERPLATGHTLLASQQLKREMLDTLTLSKQVGQVEEDVYKLEFLRKETALRGYGAPAKTTVDHKAVQAKIDSPGNKEAQIRAAMQHTAMSSQLRPAAALTAAGVVGGGGAVQASALSAGAAREAQGKAAARAAAKQVLAPAVAVQPGPVPTPAPVVALPAPAPPAPVPAIAAKPVGSGTPQVAAPAAAVPLLVPLARSSALVPVLSSASGVAVGTSSAAQQAGTPTSKGLTTALPMGMGGVVGISHLPPAHMASLLGHLHAQQASLTMPMLPSVGSLPMGMGAMGSMPMPMPINMQPMSSFTGAGPFVRMPTTGGGLPTGGPAGASVPPVTGIVAPFYSGPTMGMGMGLPALSGLGMGGMGSMGLGLGSGMGIPPARPILAPMHTPAPVPASSPSPVAVASTPTGVPTVPFPSPLAPLIAPVPGQDSGRNTRKRKHDSGDATGVPAGSAAKKGKAE